MSPRAQPPASRLQGAGEDLGGLIGSNSAWLCSAACTRIYALAGEKWAHLAVRVLPWVGVLWVSQGVPSARAAGPWHLSCNQHGTMMPSERPAGASCGCADW